MEHAHATIIAQAVLDACKRQATKGRSLDGINLESIVQRALSEFTAPDDSEVLPGATKSEIMHVMMQDIVGDYDTPDTVPEWAWVEAHASYRHRHNGEDGIWEFIVNLAHHFDDVPEKLRPVIQDARKSGAAYLVFHQGT